MRVLILGGGPAGLAAAIALARQGGRVVVIERSSYWAGSRIGEHLSPAGLTALATLGFDLGANHGTGPTAAAGAGDGTHERCFGVSSAWGAEGMETRDFVFSPPGYGLNLARPAFDRALAEQARALGASVRERAWVESVRRPPATTPASWFVETCWDGRCQREEFDLIVDASGRPAVFARSRGSVRQLLDQQVALHTLVADPIGKRTGNTNLLIEAAAQGWWYLGPMSGGRAVCMYFTDADLVRRRGARPTEHWARSLAGTTHVRRRVSAPLEGCSVALCSARTQLLDKPTGRAWVAVGDAAMSFDPLASMGITKSIEDALTLARESGSEGGWTEMAAQRYAAALRNRFESFRRSRCNYYKLEVRWPDEPFWQRRCQF